MRMSISHAMSVIRRERGIQAKHDDRLTDGWTDVRADGNEEDGVREGYRNRCINLEISFII